MIAFDAAHQERGQEPGESLRGLKRRGGKDLGNDGDKEEEPFHGAGA